MSTLKVSVLMSVYNGEQFLREAVDSILNQTFTNFEFIIVDDGSTDSTAAILDSYTAPNIVRLHNETNQGLTYSLNRGLLEAQGEYIARMDADDIALPDRLAEQVAYLDTHPEAGVVGAQVKIIDEQHRQLYDVHQPTDPLLITWAMRLNNCLWHPTTMFRRDLVKQLGGYNTGIPFAQDYDLWLRLSHIAKIGQLPTCLLEYRVHSANITSKQFEKQEQCVAAIIRQQIGSLLTGPLPDELIFGLRQLVAAYPFGTRPVSPEAIDTLVNLQAAFCRQQALTEEETHTIRRQVGKTLISFAWQSQDPLRLYALQQAARLDSQGILNFYLDYTAHLEARITHLEAHTTQLDAHIANLDAHIANVDAHVTALKTHNAHLETQKTNLEQQLAAYEVQNNSLAQRLNKIETSKIWRLALKWYAFKQNLTGERKNLASNN